MLDEENSVTDTPCGAGAQLRDRVEGWRDPVTLLLPGEVSGSLQVLSAGEPLVHSLDRCWEMCVFMAGFLSIYFCLNNEEHVTLVSSLSRSRAGSWPIPDVARAICSRRCETQRIFYKLWYYITFYLYFLQSFVPFLLPDSCCFSFLPSFSLSTYVSNVLPWSIQSISFDMFYLFQAASNVTDHWWSPSVDGPIN